MNREDSVDSRKAPHANIVLSSIAGVLTVAQIVLLFLLGGVGLRAVRITGYVVWGLAAAPWTRIGPAEHLS